MKKIFFAIFATMLLAVTFMPVVASAALFHFDYSKTGVSASGTLTADLVSSGTYHLTGITGTRNGAAITSFEQGSPLPGNLYFTSADGKAWINNILYVPSNPAFVDVYGFYFGTIAGNFNIYYDGNNYIEYNGNNNTSQVISSFNVSAVPIPAAAWLLGTGLVGLVTLRRRKK